MPKKNGIYKRPDSRYWQYYFRYKGKTYRGSTEEADRDKAVDMLYKIQYQVTRDINIEHIGNISIDDFFDKFMQNMRNKTSRFDTIKTNNTYISKFKDFLKLRYSGCKLLKEITTDMIEQYKTYLLKEEMNSRYTVYNNISGLKAIFEFAIKHSPALLKDNPVKSNFSKKKVIEERKPPVCLKPAEFEIFVDYTKKHYPKL